MRSSSIVTVVWPTIALFLSISVDAGFMRQDLLERDGVTVGQVTPGDVKDKYGQYVMDPTTGTGGQKWPFTCYNYYPVREWSEGGITYVACCQQGRELPVLGTIATKLLCCTKEEHHSGDSTTGYACCPSGKEVKGNVPSGNFLCCGSNEQYFGSKAAGHACCPAGYIYEGGTCKMKATVSAIAVPPLTDQKPLVATDSPRPRCTPAVSGSCSSGVVTGKIYQLISPDGTYWGLTNDYHSWSAVQANQQNSGYKIGSFKFCIDEACTGGIDINPSDTFSIQDVLGKAPAGIDANSWVLSYAGPDKLVRTYQYGRAGAFTITKYPGGMYCIGGASPTGSALCPGAQAGIAFAGSDVHFCVQVQLQEVVDTVILVAPTTTVTETKTVTVTPTPTPSEKFTCNGTAYFIATANDHVVSLYNMDLSTGNAFLFATNIGAGMGYANINALGYNSKEDYLYGIATSINSATFTVVRLTTTGTVTEVLKFTGEQGLNAVGDFDTNGQYWISAFGMAWMQIDLLPGSPTYATIVNRGVSDRGNYQLADWAYLNGRGEYLWSVARTRAAPVHLALVKWSLTSHQWTVHEEYKDIPINLDLVGMWGGSSDTIWALRSGDGKITRIKLGEAPYTYGSGKTNVGGDGARCALAR